MKITKANLRLIQMLNKLSGNVKSAPIHFGAIKYFVSIKLSFIPIKVVIVSMSVMAQKHLFPVSYLRVREPQKIQKQKTGWMRTIVEQLFIIQFHVLST